MHIDRSTRFLVIHKIAPFTFLAIGFIVTSVSFVYYSGNTLPYPDPTVELLAHQAAESKKWSCLLMLGLLAMAVGGAWIWHSKSDKRPKK